MNTLLCFLLGLGPIYNPGFQCISFSRVHIYPTVSVSSWGTFGNSLRTLYRIFVLGATDPDCNQNESFSAVSFYFKSICSVTTTNISKSLIALTHHRVNRSQEGIGSQVLESLLCFLPYERYWSSCRSRAFHRLNAEHANK